MSYSRTVEAIVLQTHNVGEADRFCILLTKELGRVAARAKSVRRLKSKMGGALLPFSHARLELIEHKAGYIIVGAERLHGHEYLSDVASFAAAGEGTELILRLTQDVEPLPELFALLSEFLLSCKAPSRHILLGFTLRVLHLLGFLPESSNMEFFRALREDERVFIESCARGAALEDLALDAPGRLEERCHVLLLEQLSSPLKSTQILLC
ncbi:MAG: DNA repair protein RecO [Patescibacteria group bacterium]